MGGIGRIAGTEIITGTKNVSKIILFMTKQQWLISMPSEKCRYRSRT